MAIPFGGISVRDNVVISWSIVKINRIFHNLKLLLIFPTIPVMVSKNSSERASIVNSFLQKCNFDKATKSGNPFGHRLSPF